MRKYLSPKHFAKICLDLSERYSPSEVVSALTTMIEQQALPGSRSFYRRVIDHLKEHSDQVVVETATPLSAEMQTKIQSLFTDSPKPLFRINSGLLGRFRILAGSWLVDYSLKQELKALYQTMTEVSHG